MREQKYQFTEVLLEEAIRLMKEYIVYRKEQNAEEVSLIDGLGRVAARDYISPINQPPFDRSPLDGYAVRAEDIRNASREQPVRLKVIEEIVAGDEPKERVESGMAARIMTGAPIPEGADCVIRQEDTDYGEEKVLIYKSVNTLDNICFQGEDFQAGDCLIKKDTLLSAIELGILASMGYSEISVYAKPRIGVFTTGDELMKPGEKLKPGKIYNSNLHVLWGRCKELGIEPVIADCLPDTEKEVATALEQILQQVDFVITTGGVSVGKKDIMHGALELLGAEKIFWKVLVKPGTPIIFAMAQGVPILALSGNPFGAISNLELLARPILSEMTGNRNLLPERKKAVFQNEFGKRSNVRRFIRGIYKDGEVCLPKGLHSSGVLGSMQGCNCLIDISVECAGLKPGDEVEVVLL